MTKKIGPNNFWNAGFGNFLVLDVEICDPYTFFAHFAPSHVDVPTVYILRPSPER